MTSLKTKCPGVITIALVGNPNVGKTTLFNAISGLRQHTANYAGVTVEIKKASILHAGTRFELIDLPGAYSLAARSPDELIPTNILLGIHPGETRPDLVLAILDATNLERNLYLLHQVREVGIPVIGCLTMVDLAQKEGLKWDLPTLEKKLGIGLIAVNPVKGTGIHELLDRIPQVESPDTPRAATSWPDSVNRAVATIQKGLAEPLPPFLVERALFDQAGEAERMLKSRNPDLEKKILLAREHLISEGFPLPQGESKHRYREIREILDGSLKQTPQAAHKSWTDRLDAWLTHPISGSIVFLLAMFLLFESVFLVATPAMEWLSGLVDHVSAWITDTFPPGPFTDLLAGGIVKGVGGVIVFLPQICILFAMLAFLEDTGYMARAAFLVDHIMARCGLSGKSFIPLLSSLACAVPGIMSTRVIEDRRDRFATILVAPLMSCSARLPVYVLIVTACFSLEEGHPAWLGGLLMFLLYLIGLVLAPIIALLLKKTVLKGPAPLFVLELPHYQFPSLRNVVRKVFDAASSFLVRAGTTILAAMVLVWALLYFPASNAEGESYPDKIRELEASEKKDEARQVRSQWVEASYLGRAGKAMEPIFRPLGWDWRLSVAAIASFPAREVVVGTLAQLYGQEEDDENRALTETLRPSQAGEEAKATGIPPATGLSLMVFFALCCQCVSTLVVIRRETNSWFWPIFTFVYMTLLAYVGGWAAYRIGLLIWP